MIRVDHPQQPCVADFPYLSSMLFIVEGRQSIMESDVGSEAGNPRSTGSEWSSPSQQRTIRRWKRYYKRTSLFESLAKYSGKLNPLFTFDRWWSSQLCRYSYKYMGSASKHLYPTNAQCVLHVDVVLRMLYESMATHNGMSYIRYCEIINHLFDVYGVSAMDVMWEETYAHAPL
jgi:hypothetical protein